MYPERRPYATTMPYSGYRAKPIVPQPPTDALAVLRSHVGYDDLQRSSHDDGCDTKSPPPSSVRSHAGRTYPSPTNPNALTRRLLPPTERTPQEALAAAVLEPPIEHDARVYHGCQQAVLNAELRDKVEAHSATRAARIEGIRELLANLPAESAVNGNREMESVQKYLNAYRCTEEIAVPEAELIAQSSLHTPMAEVENMTQLPPVPSDTMRHALDDLLRSPYLLAPLTNYVAKLSMLDKLSGMGWTGEGPEDAVGALTSATTTNPTPTATTTTEAAAAGTSSRAAAAKSGEIALQPREAVLCPSRAAVALHERLYFNPGDYSERELKKSEEMLLALQQQVQTAKKEKEDAIDANDPITALRSLHAQVDLSNDLLLLYKARLAQVGMHTDDVQDFRRDVVNQIDDARRAAQAVRTYAQRALPSVHYDIASTANAVEATEKTLADARATEEAAEAQVREQLCVMDGESRALWQDVLALLEKLAAKAQDRSRYVQQCLSRREQRAKATATAEARLKALAVHRERLHQCEEVLSRWEGIGDVYSKYVEACVPKLLRHLAAVEDASEALAQREAEGYVAVFEQFAYAAEEARAKRRTQADRMKLLQRNEQLNQERAEATLDPDAASHAQRLAHATQELEEVQLYLKYIDDMEAERRAEVDPVLHRVLVRHAQAQTMEGDSSDDGTNKQTEVQSTTPKLLEQDTAVTTSATTTSTPATETKKDSPAKVAASAAPLQDAQHSAVVAAVAAADAAGPATMAHPCVAARRIGLAHEANYLQKQEQLTEQELQEVEGKLTGLRHSREELRALETKYQNADAIRELLGLQ